MRLLRDAPQRRRNERNEILDRMGGRRSYVFRKSADGRRSVTIRFAYKGSKARPTVRGSPSRRRRGLPGLPRRHLRTALLLFSTPRTTTDLRATSLLIYMSTITSIVKTKCITSDTPHDSRWVSQPTHTHHTRPTRSHSDPHRITKKGYRARGLCCTLYHEALSPCLMDATT